MTDKQIIIDYKNICGNYSPKVGCTGTFDGSCIKEQCFTYKLLQQLQAKEQECEALGQAYLETNELLQEKTKECTNLKAENEELKEWQQTVKDMFNRTCRCKYNDEVSAMCKLTNKKCISINECMYRKHKTLTEIKEIVYLLNDRTMVRKDICDRLDLILQKISECEVKDENN